MAFLRFLLMAVLGLSATTAGASLSEGTRLRALPVQDGGRLKPYDTFAREVLQIIYGKTRYEDRDAWSVVFTWMLAPSVWAEKPLFEVRHPEILKALGLPTDQRWYKGNDLFSRSRFSELMQDLRVKRESKEKLTPLFQALQRLENQYMMFREMTEGRLLRVFPATDGDTWLSVAELTGETQESFLHLTKTFVAWVAEATPGHAADLDAAVERFEGLARTAHPAVVPTPARMGLELHYNDFHPFRWAYVLYLFAVLAVGASWVASRRGPMAAAWVFVGLGFLLHTYGFGLRVYLAGRAPVSNMYEVVVWVAWGGVLFAAILEMMYRSRFVLLAGALSGLVALVVADLAPVVLDPSLQPLEAVLRSNFWLVLHVMTITISYAAFFLALILADIALVYFFRDPLGRQPQIKDLVTAIYRCMQIGVALLAPGIILGGVWADYSWGRFWGWDPKETWALIVLLGYVAVLHGRLTQWIRDFGMVASGILVFSLVVMACYGVNFILGAGLHSYGFGVGGKEYVYGVMALHALAVLYVAILRRSRLKNPQVRKV